ncbi:response regulator [Undibacterium cyanobacteriorum]|uniref:histidine kinase n=1 Tax=Undibacterium cyanobacteriorum TaxID=3073561 RepID=A0ABY9RM08_9BURK|nr:response regulator [Undibacterium sp. 20NA77.5]WMW82251.1 response regulator [Undibacterium sp. 20NA77.5]
MLENPFSSKEEIVERALDGLDALRDSVERGLEIANAMRELGSARRDKTLQAYADLVDAFADYFENKLDQASRRFEALNHFFTNNLDQHGAFFAKSGLVIVWRKKGEVLKARAFCENELIPRCGTMQPRLLILALNIYAILLQECDETEKSIRFFFRALDESRKINSISRIAQITANLGEVLYVTGNAEAAEELLQEARDLAPASAEKWLTPFSSTMLALCKISLGKFEEAYEAIAQYVEEKNGGNSHTNTYRSFYFAVAAYTLTVRGCVEQARQFNESALASIDMIEDPHLKPYVWWVSGYIRRRVGEIDQAIVDLRKAIDQIGDSGYIHLPLKAINELSEIYADLGHWQQAYIEQKRHQKLFLRAQERASRVQLETLKIRYEYREAEQDRKLTERMVIERKTLDDELQRMLTERETILENSIVGMIFLNSKGRVQWVNTPLCQIFGVERENVLGASLEPFYESREAYLESGAAVSQAVLKGEAYVSELKMRRSDGSLFWVQFSGRAVNKNDLSYGTVWVVMDISARRQLEDDLHKSEYNYRLLIDNVTEGIIVVQDGKIAFANRLIESLTGYDQSELIGMVFTSSIHPEDVALVAERHARRLRGEVVEQYYQIRLNRRYTGELIWVEISSVLIQWEGHPATLSFVSDLTQRKLLETQLKESMDEQMRLQTLQMQNELKVSELARRHAEETTEAKSLFLANMSHEIRTPMNAIIGMAHLALKTELTVKQKDYVEKIHKAGMSLMGIINDILDFSKIEAGKLDIEVVDFDLDEVFNSVAVVTSEKAEEKGLEYLFDIAADVPRRLKGDPLRLGQVLINLVNNSIKFTTQGEVCLHCRVLSTTAGTKTLRFEVRDTGVGMSEAQAAKLFMPFSQGDESTTRKFGGTGLGLSICKGMVDLMGGQISLVSQEGLGTTVTFEIPFDFTEVEQAKFNRELFENLRVLIVDDHPLAARLLAEKLRLYGIACDMVHSGDQALSMILATDSERRYDAVFVDLHMPVMDGVELIACIRNAGLRFLPKIALVGATARESLNYREEATVSDAYLDKPFNTSNVFDCLVNLFSYHTHASVTKQAHTQLKCVGLRALLVEDNVINQQIAVELLEAADIVVDVASNGRIAVDKLFMKDPSFYDIVFMDVQMPEMDGHEATRLIRADGRFQSLPIIAMTAHALLIERERCFTSGMNAHIAKPINPIELYNAVAEWCQQKVSHLGVTEVQEQVEEDEEMLRIEGVDTRQGLARTMGDKQLYFKLLRLFVQDQRDALAIIREALQRGENGLAERVAHTLKGVAGLIGAEVHTQAARIELLIQSGQNVEMMTPILSACETQLALTIGNIENCLVRENATSELGGRSLDGASISSEDVLEKLRYCYRLVENYDGEALEALNDSHDELCIAFGTEVQKQIMRAASQYDFDVILSIMKGNAELAGLELR